jgi:uncharacterized protein YdcH (DUF465 family)
LNLTCIKTALLAGVILNAVTKEIYMPIEAHDLHHDFPELSEQIRDLKMNDRHFAKLFEEYDVLDKEIRHIEEQKEAASDERLETLKVRRVALKDELYTMLNQAVDNA